MNIDELLTAIEEHHQATLRAAQEQGIIEPNHQHYAFDVDLLTLIRAIKDAGSAGDLQGLHYSHATFSTLFGQFGTISTPYLLTLRAEVD